MFLVLLVLSVQPLCFADGTEPGLLFYLSGDHQFEADFASGDPKPTFLRDVKIIPDGAKGAGFECANTQLMAYKAPGNIYAERGTLSFYWRSRYPVGQHLFQFFALAMQTTRAGTWSGCELTTTARAALMLSLPTSTSRAFASLIVLPSFRNQMSGFTSALAWDETRGIRFYVNGRLAAKQETQAVLYAGLDQFGPHSRIISPMQVQSAYNFIRGGDIDEIRIYDRMLSDANVASLAKEYRPLKIPPLREI